INNINNNNNNKTILIDANQTYTQSDRMLPPVIVDRSDWAQNPINSCPPDYDIMVPAIFYFQWILCMERWCTVNLSTRIDQPIGIFSQSSG
ncbi:hypothetical protein RDWZM_003154, partial [Blomia tropicalis]